MAEALRFTKPKSPIHCTKNKGKLMDLKAKLKELGYDLPQAAAPAANYVPYVIADDDFLFVAGQIPFLNGQAMHKGRLGQDLSIEQGVEAARACALNILAQANQAVGGDFSKIK